MTTDDKLAIIEGFLSEPMSEDERKEATELLESTPNSQFSGSNAPPFLATRIQMMRATRKNTA